jgi:hypothetical protein
MYSQCTLKVVSGMVSDRPSLVANITKVVTNKGRSATFVAYPRAREHQDRERQDHCIPTSTSLKFDSLLSPSMKVDSFMRYNRMD